jgi:hypothetical protein
MNSKEAELILSYLGVLGGEELYLNRQEAKCAKRI